MKVKLYLRWTSIYSVPLRSLHGVGMYCFLCFLCLFYSLKHTSISNIGEYQWLLSLDPFRENTRAFDLLTFEGCGPWTPDNVRSLAFSFKPWFGILTYFAFFWSSPTSLSLSLGLWKLLETSFVVLEHLCIFLAGLDAGKIIPKLEAKAVRIYFFRKRWL